MEIDLTTVSLGGRGLSRSGRGQVLLIFTDRMIHVLREVQRYGPH